MDEARQRVTERVTVWLNEQFALTPGLATTHVVTLWQISHEYLSSIREGKKRDLSNEEMRAIVEAFAKIRGLNEEEELGLFTELWNAAIGVGSKDTAQESSEKPRATIVELGLFTVNYDKSLTEKVAEATDPRVKTGYLVSGTHLATDENFPDGRTGKRKYKASAVCFQSTKPSAIKIWCLNNGKTLAGPKEGIDIACAGSKLDDVTPLALAGQYHRNKDEYGGFHALCLRNDNQNRPPLLVLSELWMRRDSPFEDGWWHLVLEEVPLLRN